MAQASIGTAAARTLQVLVVDDSEAMRTRVRWALEEAGLTVVGEAADGAQALAQAVVHQPDVVLMDLHMSGMDGVEATRILRRRQPDTPVVLWSGDDEAELERALRESGAQGGLPKEIGAVELVATLREVCEAQDDVGTLADGQDGRADAPAERLTTAERTALEQLDAADGYATRWPVGRQVARSLANRQLVVVASDYVLLTEAGRRALAGGTRHHRPAPPGPGRAGHGASARLVPG